MLNRLRSRAEALRAARLFFEKLGVLEVDCGALMQTPPIDANIDVMSVSVSASQMGYLHTSPEYAMKKLLAQGSGDIYFLGHVYRKGEIGKKHSPEFTMAEWYRTGYSLSGMIEETSDFIRLFLGPLPKTILSYTKAFEIYANIDPEKSSVQELLQAAQRLQIDLPSEAKNWEKDTLVHLLLTHAIEPYLGKNELTVLTDYPPHEAALACVQEKEGRLAAERFEIYANGVELANGYHELADAKELRRRFESLNKKRDLAYPLDESFLHSLRHLPDCCGVSVGFDRVLMLQKGAQDISQVILSAWEEPQSYTST